jgi:cell fate regulator YaaT (PSP1 superfamily)
MGCGQCSTGGCGSVRPVVSGEESSHVAASGCQSKGGCGSGGCTKINSFDWLGNMSLPSSMRYDVIEIKFKGGNKEYFRNSKQLELYTGDFVVCEMPNGYHIGSVSLQGELVRLQLIKKKIKDDKSLRKVIRVANEGDLNKHEQAINRDLSTMYRSRELIQQMKLKMKLSDVEFQSDNTKATFYYSADDRVDFRELIKILAGEFKIRVEMKQISLRQEASRIGGLGSCGRELCCSTWLTDFKPIPTSAARYQNLSLNPAKLAGQCGRLKCCLNYELETYIDALSDIPKVDHPLQTEKGLATLQKTDIFRRLMWFSYEKDSNWYPIPCTQVTDIMEMNKRGEKPVSIVEMVTIDEVVTETTLNNDLAQLDKRLASKGAGGSKPKRSRKRKPNRNRSPKGKGSKPNS